MQWGFGNRFNLADVTESFFSKARRQPNGCWIWTGALGSHRRYGSVGFQGRVWLAHRLAWRLHTGKDPGESCVCHRCDNGLCINPTHLFLGTQGDNVADMETKKRSRHPRRADHGRAKLTEHDVTKIKKLSASGRSGRSIAKQFGVAAPTIYRILNGKGWV